MTVYLKKQQPKWYVLIAYKQEENASKDLEKEIAYRKAGGLSEIRYFAPIYYALKGAEGKKQRVKKPLLPNYVFIRATLDEIFQFKKEHAYLKFHKPRINGAASEYVVVPDAEMESFIRVAHAYGQDVVYYRPDEVDLEKGDRVRIIGGAFDGVEGILQCQQGKSGGQVVVEIPHVASVCTWTIEPQYIEILSFAPEARRLYNNLEAFFTKARGALLNFYSSDGVNDSDVAALGDFVRRLQHLKTDTKNAESKLLILLLMSHTVLRNEEERKTLLQRCHDFLPHIKSDMQRAFHLVYMYACTGDVELRETARAITDTWQDIRSGDKKRRELIEDLDVFTQLARF